MLTRQMFKYTDKLGGARRDFLVTAKEADLIRRDLEEGRTVLEVFEDLVCKVGCSDVIFCMEYLDNPSIY
jgi:hypothetical protein